MVALSDAEIASASRQARERAVVVRGPAAGVLLARAGTSDVIDAALVLLAADGDEVLTSDPDDLAILAAASGVHADLVRL